MANLTIRKLDDAIRDELRLRAARNGRSVEDEVRVILRDAAQHQGQGREKVKRLPLRRSAPVRCKLLASPPTACRASP